MKILAAATLVAAIAAGVAFAPRVVRAINRGREIPILMYHNVLDGDNLSVWQVSAEEFSRQMDELKADGWTAVLPDEIERATRGLFLLPRKPFVITFDDGYEGVLKNAEPVLARNGFRAICYLIVGLLGGEGEDRGVFDSGPLLSTNEVAAMAARGTISFGSHSMTHVPSVGRLAREIRESRYALRRLTGVKTHSYCYPHGIYGQDAMYEALRSVKFRTALTCEPRFFRMGVDTNLLAMPRVSVYGGNHEFHLESFDVSGGVASATVRNDGLSILIRCMLREKSTGRTFISDGAAHGIGKGPKTEGAAATFSWTGLPDGAAPSNYDVVVCEENALFTYPMSK